MNQIRTSQFKVKWKETNQMIGIALYYEKALFSYNEKRTKMLFTTESIPNLVNGFIKIPGEFYIKLSITDTPSELTAKELSPEVVKIGVDKKRKKVSFSIFCGFLDAILLKNGGFVNLTSAFVSEDLKMFHYSVILSRTPDIKVIQTTTNVNSNSKANKARRVRANDNAHLRARDFMASDQFRYGYSPNADGQRNKRESFAGTGSNIGQRRF